MLSLRCILFTSTLFTPCFSTSNPQTTLHRRQDTETRTVDPLTSSMELQGGATTVVPSPTTPYRLATATTPIQLADTIGLIMPNPWSKVYVGLNYSLGFVDVVPRPAPTVGGWLRQIQPLLILPNNIVNVFPASGSHEVDDEFAIPIGSDGFCGFTAENYAISYPFTFSKSGWYMLIINQTMLQPTISSEHTCQNPFVSQDIFFATQSFSVAPQPTDNLAGIAKPSAYTVFADVSKQMPGKLPIDPQKMTSSEKLGVGLGVSAGILAFIGMVVAIFMLRKRRRDFAELTAFNRLSETAKAEFLAENPDSRLNPNHPRNIRDSRLAPGMSFSNRPPAPPGTMSYQQWYWDTLMRGQAGQQEMQYNSVNVGDGQVYHNQGGIGMGMGMGQDQYVGQVSPHNGQISHGFNGQIPPGYTTSMQMQFGYNNGPLPALPNQGDYNRQMPMPINNYGTGQYGPQMAQVPPNMHTNIMGYQGR